MQATERLFRIAIAIKGIDGAVQLVGGVILALVPLPPSPVSCTPWSPATHLEAAAENFAALDVVIIVLVVREYLQTRRERAKLDDGGETAIPTDDHRAMAALPGLRPADPVSGPADRSDPVSRLQAPRHA